MRLSKHLVVLFNGEEKEGPTLNKSSALRIKFYEAQKYVKAIEKALQNNIIRISSNERFLLDGDNKKTKLEI